jgi:PAS domain S-box-containing protein
MKGIHSLLKRQLERCSGSQDAAPREWREFMQAVSDAYCQFDADRKLLERSLELSSQELLEANSELRAIFQAFPDLFLRLDHEGTITDCKGGRTTIFVVPVEKLVGKRIQDIPFGQVASRFLQAIHDIRETKAIVNIEYSMMMEGRENYYEARLLPFLGDQIIAIVRNITERKQAELEVEKLQRYNRGLIEANLDPLVTFDQEGIILDVNKATVKATGRTREELIGTPFATYFTNPEKARKGAMLVFEAGEVRDYELIMEAADGTRTIVAYNASVYRDQTGQVVGAFAAARDITERRHADQKIEDLQRYNRGLIEASLDPLVTFDQEGIILDVNKATVKTTGRTREELIGTPFATYFTNPEKARKGAMLVFEAGEVRDYELIMEAADGTRTIVAYNASVYRDQTGQVVGAFAAARDITERRHAEQRIEDLQRYNRGLIEAGLDPLVTFDQEGIILDVNEATVNATGRTREELIGTPFANYFTDPEKARKGAMLVFEAGEVRDYELIMEAADGTRAIVAYNASVYRDQTGQVVGAFADARDITERRHAEQKIKDLQRYNRGLIEASLDPLVTFDQEGIILDVNKATVNATGRTREELIGTPFATYFTDPEKARKGAMLVFEAGEVRDYELIMEAADGTRAIVAYNASVYSDETGQVVGAFAAARDITELKRSEAEVRKERDKVKETMEKLIETQDRLIRSERFAAIGEAAAYLSHEIKNPLAIIGGFARQIEKSLGENHGNRQKLKIIQDEIRRLELMLTDVKDFTRPSKPQLELQDINSVIESILALMESDLGDKGIDYEKNLDRDLPLMFFDLRQIEQVLINLIKNAVEAMPDGGRLIVSSWFEDEHIKVSIVDSGSGMPPEIVQKIFNSFFTTKKKGTGLGLAVCQKIMEDHEGRIFVQSEQGKGTRFTIECSAKRPSG